ncbi:hypothetical protein [Actinoplanes utahensis]|uniref:hypothetical protein n=1 Tax=Actinoplanes utahensis TaxID=1869 RepID=UPI00068E62BA|nr:hypothetical protein [Actinoplanes utahensis]GIF35654.1 hypothetical protein Aut01nite_86400 [Actinoplanes utahensis]
MSDAYTVYWPQDRWRNALGVHGPLEVMFGGPHLSEPSFRRAKVTVGDLLYPIGVNQQVLYVFGRMRVREIVEVDGASLQEHYARFRPWRFLAPTCTDEVVLGEEGTPVHGNHAVPSEALKTLTYLPRRRGPRPIKHVSEAGLLTKAISIQGIYRLAPASVVELDAVLDSGPTFPSAVPPRPASRPHVNPASLGMEPLF